MTDSNFRGSIFAANGYLPATNITMNTDEFYRAFVDAFPYSTTRKRLYHLWIHQVELANRILPPTFQWIGGSYTTSKLDPGDIDIIIGVDGEKFDELSELDRTELLHNWRLPTLPEVDWSPSDAFFDRYLVAIYEGESPLREAYCDVYEYWEKRWSSTRPALNGVTEARGFVRIENSR